MSSNRSASNKTANNSKPRSKPTPVTRKRLQAMALSGNPLHSISSNGNRIQSRNIHLLTNVREIKDHCKTLQSQLERMQRESEVQCEELYDKLKKTDGKEIDHLKGLLKKCNDEKEEKDEKITKYEETVRKVMESYTKDKEKYKEYLTEIKQQLKMCKKENEEKDEIITKVKEELEICNKEKEEKDEKITKYEEAVRKVKEAYTKDKAKYEEYYTKIKQQLEKCKKEKEEYKTGKSHGNLYKPDTGYKYNKSRSLPSELKELNISRRRVKPDKGDKYNYLGRITNENVEGRS